MGIKGLKKFLQAECPQCFTTIPFAGLGGKKIAVDIASYIYKYKTAIGEEKWFQAMIRLVLLFKRNNVHGIFIFDGAPPKEKDAEKQKRKKRREDMDEKTFRLSLELETYKETHTVSDEFWEIYQSIRKYDTNTGKIHRLLHAPSLSSSETQTQNQDRWIDVSLVESYIIKKESQLIHITGEDIQNIQTLISLCGGIWIQAPGEAEALGSYLCSTHQCAAILSEDSDVLAYGSEFYISGLNPSTETCMVICYQSVLSILHLSPPEFLDFCIMCGTDYNENIPGIAIKTAFKLLSVHRSIDQLPFPPDKISILHHLRSRHLFQTYGELSFTDKIDYWDPNVDTYPLRLFLRSHRFFLRDHELEEMWNQIRLPMSDDDGKE